MCRFRAGHVQVTPLHPSHMALKQTRPSTLSLRDPVRRVSGSKRGTVASSSMVLGKMLIFSISQGTGQAVKPPALQHSHQFSEF